MPVTENKLTDYLIALRNHYQQVLTEADTNAAHYRDQLAHVNALLLDQLAPTNGTLSIQVPLEAVPASLAPSAQAEVSEQPTLPALTSDSAKVASAPKALPPEPIKGSREPRPLLPAYQGMKRLEAIAHILQATPGQEVTRDSLIHSLFGALNAAEQKVERKRLNTLLYQGEKLELWQKGKNPSSYLIGTPNSDKPTAAQPPTTKAETPQPKPKVATSQPLTLPLLPIFEGLNKLEAIKKLLTEQSGHVLHQDTIFQLLYGDVSPEVLKQERVRIRASLVQGVNKELWEKAPDQPSSYWIQGNTVQLKDADAASTTETPAVPPVGSSARETKALTASSPRKSLPLLPAYAGLKKQDAIAKVLAAASGEVLHQDSIIKALYGDLSPEDLREERVRIKTALLTGVRNELWSKDSTPSSYFLQGQQPKKAAKKTSAKASPKPKAAEKTSKSSRKRSSKRNEAELVELLRKADIQI